MNIFMYYSKQTSIEIEQLSARVIEAETKLKSEITRIKKKFQITITELEMSLDVANRTNLDLQKTVKKQSMQLTELSASYEEIQRQLQSTIDQYAIAQRRIQSMSGELEEVRANYEQSLRSKRAVEISLEEASTKNSELLTINVSLQNTRAKIEAELQSLAADYEEVTRELRISDERYQKVQIELKHTVEILHEEQERIVKIEAIKKSLEVEVKVSLKSSHLFNYANYYKSFISFNRTFQFVLKKLKPMLLLELVVLSPNWKLQFAILKSNWILKRRITLKQLKF
jgi:chromosome segregation ATPase